MIASLLATVKDARRSNIILTVPGFAGRQYLVRFVRGLCALVLVSLLLGLTPAAYADPPDPTWLGGYWDDDDFDNVVAFIASAAAIAASPVADGRPSSVAKHGVELARPPARSGPLQALACPRAPPVSLSSDN
jgi:hypothetical protein